MSECHSVACYSGGFEYVVPFLDFEPYSSEVLDRDHFSFITKPIPCPGDWGFCSFKDLSIHVVPCVSSVANGDGILGSWFNSEWAFDCHKFRWEGEVCVESIQPPVSSFS